MGANRSFQVLVCPDRMSDGTPGIVQRIQTLGLPTLASAKRLVREAAKHPNQPTGYFWVADHRGVPMYGIMVTEEPKTERIPTERRPHPTIPGGFYEAGFTTRTVPGQVQRRLKPGNMPWNRGA